MVVLDDAEARTESTKLIEREIAGSESAHRQFSERGTGLQRGVVPVMQVKQVNLIDTKAF